MAIGKEQPPLFRQTIVQEKRQHGSQHGQDAATDKCEPSNLSH
jgi:hypothetical protein